MLTYDKYILRENLFESSRCKNIGPILRPWDTLIGYCGVPPDGSENPLWINKIFPRSKVEKPNKQMRNKYVLGDAGDLKSSTWELY